MDYNYDIISAIISRENIYQGHNVKIIVYSMDIKLLGTHNMLCRMYLLNNYIAT